MHGLWWLRTYMAKLRDISDTNISIIIKKFHNMTQTSQTCVQLVTAKNYTNIIFRIRKVRRLVPLFGELTEDEKK